MKVHGAFFNRTRCQPDRSPFNILRHGIEASSPRGMQKIKATSTRMGSRIILATQGRIVNRKRVQRLIWVVALVGIYQQASTSRAAAAHKVYPYLLGGITVERVNTSGARRYLHPMAKGGLRYPRSENRNRPGYALNLRATTLKRMPGPPQRC
jgi:hypothetical protein